MDASLIRSQGASYWRTDVWLIGKKLLTGATKRVAEKTLATGENTQKIEYLLGACTGLPRALTFLVVARDVGELS